MKTSEIPPCIQAKKMASSDVFKVGEYKAMGRRGGDGGGAGQGRAERAGRSFESPESRITQISKTNHLTQKSSVADLLVIQVTI